MPELPEVQTIVDDLNKKIKGDTITDFWSDAPGSIKNATAAKFKKAIVGKKIISAHRIGKNMFIDLTGGKTMYIHLKMTGHLLVKEQETRNKEQKNFKFQISNFKSSSNDKILNNKTDYFKDRVNQYIHHKWFLNSGIKNSKLFQNSKFKIQNFDKTLEFSDMRKFAKIVLIDTKDLRNYKDMKLVGVDVMSPEFTFKKFEEILSKKQKMPIGIILMAQELMAGIGNIYRSEILFESGILPERLIKDLSPKERKEVYKNIGKVLKRAIKLRGTSDSDYRDTSGAPGSFQKVMRVYNKEKKNCPKCGTIIARKKIGGRSVFYCSRCQK